MNKILVVFALVSAQVALGQHHHNEQTESESLASQGIFEDVQVKDRALTDWAGRWQSVYPYVLSGDLDPVFEVKAAQGDKSFDEYKHYYSIGYKGHVDVINIEGSTIQFDMDGQTSSCDYDYSGHKILTYESGKKGVRYLFECSDSNSTSPKFIQFSDHIIAPKTSDHFHIYMGDSSHEELLQEMENWPTYYPASLSKDEIVDEMIGHDHAGAHEHGASKIDIVIEDDHVELNLEGALSNFLSFEYAPKSDQDLKEVALLNQKFQHVGDLFELTETADCSVKTIALGSDVITAEHLSVNLADLAVGYKPNETHGNLLAKIVWQCNKPNALSSLKINLFEYFPNMEHITVQMLTPKGQKSAELSESMTKIEW